MELVHVFLLHVFLEGQIKSRDMFFYSVDDCVYFAQRLHKQSASGKITAYCLPVKIDPEKTKVY